jgi:hypothetical protein
LGRQSRDKGARTERAIVRLLQDRGFAAEKVSRMYKPGEDLSVPLLGRDLRIEVKCRASGFKFLYDAIEHRDALIVKADRREALLVVRLSLGAEVASKAEGNK